MFSAAHSCKGQLRQRHLLVHTHVCIQHPFGLFSVLLQGNASVSEALDIPIQCVHMTFTPSALASAFTHKHVPSTFETTLAPTMKHNTAHAMIYTFQSQTVKPVFRSDSTVSVMELIAAAHASVPHDSGIFLPGFPLPPPGASGQELCGMTRGRGQ